MTHEQLDLDQSLLARDEALELVARRSATFMAAGTQSLGLLPPGEYTGEEIRLKLTAKGIVPHHPNAWGALIMTGVRLGILVNTGRTTKMRVKSSHARRTSIYRKVTK